MWKDKPHGEKKTVESTDVICWNRDSSFFWQYLQIFLLDSQIVCKLNRWTCKIYRHVCENCRFQEKREIRNSNRHFCRFYRFICWVYKQSLNPTEKSVNITIKICYPYSSRWHLLIQQFFFSVQYGLSGGRNPFQLLIL